MYTQKHRLKFSTSIVPLVHSIFIYLQTNPQVSSAAVHLSLCKWHPSWAPASWTHACIQHLRKQTHCGRRQTLKLKGIELPVLRPLPGNHHPSVFLIPTNLSTFARRNLIYIIEFVSNCETSLIRPLSCAWCWFRFQYLLFIYNIFHFPTNQSPKSSSATVLQSLCKYLIGESEGRTYTCYSHAPFPFKYINPCDTVCVIGNGCSCAYTAIIQTTVNAFHMPPCPEVIMSPLDLHRSCGGWVWYSTPQENEYATASHYKNKQKFSYITGRLGMVDY